MGLQRWTHLKIYWSSCLMGMISRGCSLFMPLRCCFALPASPIVLPNSCGQLLMSEPSSHLIRLFFLQDCLREEINKFKIKKQAHYGECVPFWLVCNMNIYSRSLITRVSYAHISLVHFTFCCCSTCTWLGPVQRGLTSRTQHLG